MTPKPAVHRKLKLRRPDPSKLSSGFPTMKIARRSRYYRSIKMGNGPWYFNSSDDFRFNLPAPEGTCYIATDIRTAVMERLGEHLANGPIPRNEVDRMQVAEIELQQPTVTAMTGHEDAALFGCHREIATTENYKLTQEWALAFRKLPAEAIAYESRLTSAAEMNALALFGPAGDAGHPVKATIRGAEAITQAGMSHLVAPPRPKGKTMASYIAQSPRPSP